MRLSLRPVLATITLALTLATTAPALAQAPDDFVKTGHAQLETLLKQPASAQRDAQIASTFDKMVDYNELVRRCFQQHWAELDDAKKAEVTDLLKQIVQKNYRINLKRTLDFNVTYTGTRGQGSDTVVRTVAQSKTDARAAPVQIDYVVQGPADGPQHVVDIIAENSSTTRNYYTQFHQYLTDPSKGYAVLVQKLKEKIARLNTQTP